MSVDEHAHYWLLEPERDGRKRYVAVGLCRNCGELRIHGPARLTPEERSLGRLEDLDVLAQLVANPSCLSSFRIVTSRCLSRRISHARF
jgi:hypothetical protein